MVSKDFSAFKKLGDFLDIQGSGIGPSLGVVSGRPHKN